MTDIFIGYRRSDGGHAGRLYDRLQDWFGADKVFMDIESLRGGQAWRSEIEQSIRRARVSIIVIGQHWFSPENQKRLTEDDDVTRKEICIALECRRSGNGDEVIPVLAGNAGMPEKSCLPQDISDLTEPHAHCLEETKYKESVTTLLTILQKDYGLKCKYILEDEMNKFNKVQAFQDIGYLSADQADQIRLDLIKKSVGL